MNKPEEPSMSPIRLLNVEWRFDMMVYAALIIMSILWSTNKVVAHLSTSVALANDRFATATKSLAISAQHEDAITTELIGLQNRQQAVIELENDNAEKIKALMKQMGKTK